MLERKVQNLSRSLSALEQALYVLKRISEGRSRKDIVEEFDGDEQLIKNMAGWLKEIIN